MFIRILMDVYAWLTLFYRRKRLKTVGEGDTDNDENDNIRSSMYASGSPHHHQSNWAQDHSGNNVTHPTYPYFIIFFLCSLIKKLMAYVRLYNR